MNRLFIIVLALISLISFSTAGWLVLQGSESGRPDRSPPPRPAVAESDTGRNADGPTARDDTPRDAPNTAPADSAREETVAAPQPQAAVKATAPVPPRQTSPRPPAPERDSAVPPPPAGDGASGGVSTNTADPNAAPFRLSLPVPCILNGQCFVQSYVDIDPDAGERDFRCGSATYNGHKGTDFALRSLARMQRGMDVLAAADGIVRAIRDGEPDQSVDERGREAIRGRECGNAVVIVHPGGWETQYCHLKQGSVRVKPTQPVRRGQRLGEIGLSGKTQFPHLHLSVRQGGQPVDPFSGRRIDGHCSADDAVSGLWQADAAAALPYRLGGLVASGFADDAPTRDTIRSGALGRLRFSAGASTLFLWTEAHGVTTGDQLALRLSGPDGTVLVVKRGDPLPRNRARQAQWIGRKRPPAGWPAGAYTGEIWLLRPDGSGGERTVDYHKVVARIDK